MLEIKFKFFLVFFILFGIQTSLFFTLSYHVPFKSGFVCGLFCMDNDIQSASSGFAVGELGVSWSVFMGDGVQFRLYLVSQSGFGRLLAVALSELAKSWTDVSI